MARGNTSTAHVVITMEGKQTLDFMKQLQQQTQRVRDELEQMEQTGQQGTDGYNETNIYLDVPNWYFKLGKCNDFVIY